ncbi:hypothetical protein Btru_016074 [Bulinus truncatus]|nr:hypothetical protein Btru_016074 [Bulinus truncatus]
MPDIRIQLINPLTDDRGLYDAYYYAISDIQLVSRCWCNLHASFCNYGADGFYCDCQHNTTGKNCEMCQPLFNERPWQKGSYIPYPKGQANECIKCECNDHALSCTYNATYDRGICDTCLHNTTGFHCQSCAPTYFPDVSVALNDINRCLECKCEPLGVLDNNLSCAQAENSSVKIGQCNCKPLVTSMKCDTCVSGYYGLLTGPTPGACSACNCSQMGTVGGSINCTQVDGQCSCKQTVTGRTCDTCKDTYYSFPTNNPLGECSSCGCDKGGALSPICDKVTGFCTCRTNITGNKCTAALPGTYVPAVDILIYQPVPGQCNVTSDLYTDQAPFDGGKFAVCDVSSRNVTMEFDTIIGGQLQKDVQWPYVLAVRYSTNSSWVSGTVKLQATGSTSADLSPYAKNLGPQNFTPQCPHTGLIGQVDMKFTSDSVIKIDSLLLLPTLSSTDGIISFNFYAASDNRTVLQENYLSCLQQLSALKTRQLTLSTSCREILFSVGAELFNGSKGKSAVSVIFVDSVSSSTCQELGGQCQCKSGVSGRACDICTPGYFNFSENGCSRCPVLPCAIEAIIVRTTTAIPTIPTSITTTTNVTVLDSSDNSGLSGGYIALIVVCTALFIGFIVFLIWCLCKKCGKKQKTIERGLYTMTHFGLDDPNGPLYSNNIYDQSHWADGLGNEHRAATAILNGDIESDSVFEAHSELSGSSFSQPKFYIASDENTSSWDRKKETKLQLHTVSKIKKSTTNNKGSHRHQIPNKSYDSLNVDFGSIPNRDVVSLRKPRSRSEDTNAKELNSTFGYGLNHWRPLSDLRESEVGNRFSPAFSPNFYPYLHGRENHDNKMKEPLHLIEKPLKKSPKKPARKKKPKRHSSILDKILPPPLMYLGDSSTFIPDPDYDTMSESSFFIPKPDYPLIDGYDNPAFIPKPDYPFIGSYDNPVFIPKPDYSFIGGYSNPVFIPEPDYPRYAGYGYFDEVNGSLV